MGAVREREESFCSSSGPTLAHSEKFSFFLFSFTFQTQEGYIEELSTCFYLDTPLLKSSERLLSETKIFNIKMTDTHFISVQDLFLQKDTLEILSIPPSIFLG